MVKNEEFNHEKHQDAKWTKISILAAAFLLPIIFLFSMFSGYKFAENAKTTADTGLTMHTIQQIDGIGTADSNIMAIQIVTADMPKNTRRVIYMYIKDPMLKKIYNVWIDTRLSPDYAIFTADTPDNNRIIKLVNHEIVCTPISDTITYRVYPEVGKYVSTMCAIGVPPSYGKFAGIIGIMLRTPPSETELSIIEASLKHIALEVFEDISKP
jgi:hypothetical protein